MILLLSQPVSYKFWLSSDDARELESILAQKKAQLVPVSENLVDAIWEDRPEHTLNEVFVHSLEYSGSRILCNQQENRIWKKLAK